MTSQTRVVPEQPTGRLPPNSLAAHYLGRALMRLGGWRVEGELPRVPRAVLLAAPHTSSWDGYHMLVLAAVLRLRLRFMAKRSLFRGPLGLLLRGFGAIPIDRGHAQDVVPQMVQAFAEHPGLALVIPPAGTRKKQDHWKSGFYRIALAAGVPVVCTSLDYARKVGRVGPTLTLTGDMQRDMEQIRQAYAGVQARYPDQTSTIRLRGESADRAPD